MNTLWVICVDNAIDTICETKITANKERKWLKTQCDRVRTFVIDHDNIETCWKVADAIQSVFDNGKPFGRKGMAKLSEEHSVTIKLI